MDGLYKKERSETFDEDGWYRTGDKGFFRDSYLFFTGRSTEMIKTGGANVAPREVELALESLAGRPSRLRRRPARREAGSAGGLPRLSGAGHRDRPHRTHRGSYGIFCRRTRSHGWSRSCLTRRRRGCRRGRSASPAWSTCSRSRRTGHEPVVVRRGEAAQTNCLRRWVSRLPKGAPHRGTSGGCRHRLLQ